MNFLDETKICTLCKTEKHITLFKKQKKSKSGFGSWCKECHSKKVCEYQLKNRDKANKNNQKYSKTDAGMETKKRYKQSMAGKLAKKRYNLGEAGKAASIRHASNRRQHNKTVKNTLTSKEWVEIFTHQNNMCNICNIIFDDSNIKTRAERDHILPLSKGGALIKENVQALCRSCNSKKGNKINFQLEDHKQ